MTHKEAIIKSLAWRFFIAIPFGIVLSYIYLDQLYEAIEMTIVGNVIVTFLYYTFDVYWFKVFSKKFEKNTY